MNSGDSHKSLQEELRFKIGEQYELNEFNLKTLESTFKDGIEYENYEYIKDDFKALFGLKLISNVILQYNGDVLSSVIYEFEITHYNYLSSKLSEYTFKDIILEVLVKDKTHCQTVMQKK